MSEPPDDYDIGSQTIDETGAETELHEESPVMEVEDEVYGRAKPKRVVIRAKVIHDSG